MIELNGKQLCEFCFAQISANGECDCSCKDNPSDALRCGSILNGRYLVGSQIRENRITKEYLCYDSHSDSTVIVKEFFPKLFVNRSATAGIELADSGKLDVYNASMQKFIELMQIPQSLPDSECFVKVLGAFYENATAYFVIRNHSSLSVKESVMLNGRSTVKSVVKALANAINALSILHEASLFNGNISASNVYISNKGLQIDGFEPNEDDFATLMNEPMVFNRTSYYMSAADFGKRGRGIGSDIFSLGAVLYTMLTAKFPESPFDGGSQFDIAALESSANDVSLINIIKKMCRIDTEGYKDPQALAEEADALLKKYGLKQALKVSEKKAPVNRFKIFAAVCAAFLVLSAIITLVIVRKHTF